MHGKGVRTTGSHSDVVCEEGRAEGNVTESELWSSRLSRHIEPAHGSRTRENYINKGAVIRDRHLAGFAADGNRLAYGSRRRVDWGDAVAARSYVGRHGCIDPRSTGIGE